MFTECEKQISDCERQILDSESRFRTVKGEFLSAKTGLGVRKRKILENYQDLAIAT